MVCVQLWLCFYLSSLNATRIAILRLVFRPFVVVRGVKGLVCRLHRRSKCCGTISITATVSTLSINERLKCMQATWGSSGLSTKCCCCVLLLPRYCILLPGFGCRILAAAGTSGSLTARATTQTAPQVIWCAERRVTGHFLWAGLVSVRHSRSSVTAAATAVRRRRCRRGSRACLRRQRKHQRRRQEQQRLWVVKVALRWRLCAGRGGMVYLQLTWRT